MKRRRHHSASVASGAGVTLLAAQAVASELFTNEITSASEAGWRYSRAGTAGSGTGGSTTTMGGGLSLAASCGLSIVGVVGDALLGGVLLGGAGATLTTADCG